MLRGFFVLRERYSASGEGGTNLVRRRTAEAPRVSQ